MGVVSEGGREIESRFNYCPTYTVLTLIHLSDQLILIAASMML